MKVMVLNEYGDGADRNDHSSDTVANSWSGFRMGHGFPRVLFQADGTTDSPIRVVNSTASATKTSQGCQT